MARTDNLTNFLTDVADAIRDKKGTTGLIQASNFDTEIESIEVGGGITTGLEYNSIDSDGFPLIVTTNGLTQIPNGFFRNVNENNGQFTRTTKINLNVGISEIGPASFRECGSLSSLVVYSESVPILSNSNAFLLTPIADGTGYIYVLDDLVDSYKSATNWSTYAEQIKSISELG